jgi:hypothetical protein
MNNLVYCKENFICPFTKCPHFLPHVFDKDECGERACDSILIRTQCIPANVRLTEEEIKENG